MCRRAKSKHGDFLVGQKSEQPDELKVGEVRKHKEPRSKDAEHVDRVSPSEFMSLEPSWFWGKSEWW